jgi:hypothetical protein
MSQDESIYKACIWSSVDLYQESIDWKVRANWEVSISQR